MRRLKISGAVIAVAAAILLVPVGAHCQTLTDNTGTQERDSAAVLPVMPVLVDSSLINVPLFALLEGEGGGRITVNQTPAVRNMFDSYVSANVDRRKSGYRILVYSDNTQSARANSENIEKTLRATYPMEVYRNYSAPFFTVHIGNFRTKADAMRLCNELLAAYPQAKIVRSAIDWHTF